MFLVRRGKPKVKHIWMDGDTACRLASTGGLNVTRYELIPAHPAPTCSMCKTNAAKPPTLRRAWAGRVAAAKQKYRERKAMESRADE